MRDDEEKWPQGAQAAPVGCWWLRERRDPTDTPFAGLFETDPIKKRDSAPKRCPSSSALPRQSPKKVEPGHDNQTLPFFQRIFFFRIQLTRQKKNTHHPMICKSAGPPPSIQRIASIHKYNFGPIGSLVYIALHIWIIIFCFVFTSQKEKLLFARSDTARPFIYLCFFVQRRRANQSAVDYRCCCW